MADLTLQAALRALNEAAYAAEKAARKAGDSRAEELRAIAWRTDALADEVAA